MAPEIVRRVEYEGKPVDIWSLGILLYALLCGCFPFRAKAYPDLYRRIARGTFQIPEELSAPVKDLLRVLLTVDPEQRVTSHTALRHSWLQVQYINAPNMDKLRQEMTTLISEKPADDLDEQVLTELTAFGMTRDEVIRLVLTKTHSSLATLYYLLLDVVVNRRKAAKKSASGANLIQNPNSSNPMSLNAALNAKYARKTVAANPSGATQTLLQTQGGVNNFPSPIVNQAGNTKAMPVTSGPISVTQAVNDAAMLTAQQQQQQFLQQQYLEASNNPADYRTSSRPKSAAQSRVSNLNTLMGSANAAGAQLVNGSTNSSNNSNANPILAGYAAAPNMNPAATTTQRPLSAYAGRR
jgi:serine/threonine protein kinase